MLITQTHCGLRDRESVANISTLRRLEKRIQMRDIHMLHVFFSGP
jgi:hypothetical protein